jgi:hypothetical protein
MDSSASYRSADSDALPQPPDVTEILGLQRTAGNRAVTELVGGGVPRTLARRAPTRKKRTRTPPADIGHVRELASHAGERVDSLEAFLKRAKEDLKTYRSRFAHVSNQHYRDAYESYKKVIKEMNKSADTEQFLVNNIFSFVSNVGIGALGNALQEAKRIGAAVNLYGGSAVNTGTGNLTPQIQKAEISENLNPAVHQARGLQKLDDLNAVVLEIAATSVGPLSRPVKLAEQLIAELRVASAGGKRELSDEQVRQGVAELEGYDTRGRQLMEVIGRTNGHLDKLMELFNRSPFPSRRHCEQDIWISWMSHQGPGWRSVLFRDELHERLIFLGLATEDIGFEPGQPDTLKGGRLGVATRGLTDRVGPGGHIWNKDAATWLRDASLNELKYVAQYWSSIFLDSEPPYLGKEY